MSENQNSDKKALQTFIRIPAVIFAGLVVLACVYFFAIR
jgi:hypothetical protein